VIDRRRVAKTSRRAGDEVGFGRMEVAAGRIDAKRPSRRLELFPSREAQRVPQEIGQYVAGTRMRERKHRRATVRPEGIRLRRPVQITERPGEAVEMVLGAVVIVANV